MPPRTRLALAAAILVAALGYAAFTVFGPAPVEVEEAVMPPGVELSETVEDSPGPYLEIEVAGEANGTVVIDLFEEAAPKHVAQIVALAGEGAYDGVVFHRVIDGFMAQTGDVEHGKLGSDMRRAGTGSSSRPDLPAEFSDIPFRRGIVGMARAQDINSANSQFFIMFAEGGFLNGQYTVVGAVTEGMDVVDAIKRGAGPNGAVIGQPDAMEAVRVRE